MRYAVTATVIVEADDEDDATRQVLNAMERAGFDASASAVGAE